VKHVNSEADNMPERRVCTFSGEEIEPGTGQMYVRRDGTVLWFKSSKARKNMVNLKRNSRKVKWTRHYVKGGIQ
jgi:large subunit ribosomal protein L24e